MIRGVNWVGDAVMTMPAIRAIRRAMPEAAITLLVKPWVSGLFEKDPNIDRIMLYGEEFAGINGKLRLALALRQKDFDEAILLQNAFDAALLCFLAGIPTRIGYARDARGWLLSKPVACHGEDRNMHHSMYYLNLLEKAGITATAPESGHRREDPWIYLELEERLKARKALAALGLRRPIVGLNPGAAFGPAKRWPAARFRELATAIIGELGGGVLIFGSAKEAPAADEIARGLEGAVSMAGNTTLRQLAAFISECDALVSNDSGPMHVGYAVGAPLVALFGSTEPALTGPGVDTVIKAGGSAVIIKKDLPCSPCFKRECARAGSLSREGNSAPCMDAITVSEVFSSLKSVLPARRAVFFDRDGTLCRDANYLARWEDFYPFGEDLKQLSRLKQAGFKLIGVTNQSGVNRGVIKEEFVKEVNGYFGREYGFDAFYYCPHHPGEFCSCRKPSPGMLLNARRDLGIDLKNSFMIGDRGSDVLAARAAGARAIMLAAEGPGQAKVETADFTARSLTEAVDYIIESENA